MKFRIIYTFVGLLFLSLLFLSSSAGRNDARANAPGDSGFCSSCHTGSGVGNVSLTGAPSGYVAGVTYPLTLTINDAGAAIGGFQIVAIDPASGTNTQVGTFSVPSGTRLNPLNRLVQSTPLAFSGGSVSWTFNWTAPSAGAPSNVRFYFAGNAANGINGNDSGDNAYANSTGNIPLPVELSFFEIEQLEDETVKLNWQTQSEQNSDYFEIQRSHEENENEFEAIGRIYSAGNSNATLDYEFIDEDPIFNQHSYYRLKQVDLDGKVEYSQIKSLKVQVQEALTIYPNPIRSGEFFNLKYTSPTNRNRRVHIVNSSGQKVFETEINSNEGLNKVEIQIPELAIGTYFISVFQNGDLVDVKKMLVQE